MHRNRPTDLPTRRHPAIAPAGAGVALAVALLHGCGGGGSDPAPAPAPAAAACVKSVVAGFRGDPNWERSPGDASVGGGADGDGGIGVGGALGQFQGATITVRTLAGETIGTAVTGSDGLVTVKVCDAAGPFLFEVQGSAGARYFDEAKGALVTFAAGESLRAVVASIDRNVGITFATEAAWQWLVAQGLGDSGTGTAGAAAPGPKAVATAAKVREANETIRTLVNGLIDPDFAVDDVARLPVMVGPATAAGSVGDTRAGRYALLNAAFAKQAGTFNSTLATPALAGTRQFAQDATDAAIDGRRRVAGAQGATFSAVAPTAYDPVELPRALAASLAAVSAAFGAPALQQAAQSAVPQFGAYSTGAGDLLVDVVLRGDGVVRVADTAGAGGTAAGAPPADARRLFRGGGGALFAKTGAGTVHGIGDNASGQLGVGDQVDRSAFVRLPALDLATSIAGSNFVAGAVRGSHSLARLSDGRVLAWGSNVRGQLNGDPGGASPTPLPALDAGAVAVAAVGGASFAVMDDGTVLAWGTPGTSTAGQALVGTGVLGDGDPSTATRAQGPVLAAASQPLAGVVALATPYQHPPDPALPQPTESVVAVLGDGRVYAWGLNISPRVLPAIAAGPVQYATQVAGLAGIARVAASSTGFVALGRDGRVWYWGTGPSATVVAPTVVQGLPATTRVRELLERSGTVEAVDASGARWRIDFASATRLP